MPGVTTTLKPTRNRLTRPKKWALIIGGSVVVYALIGFLVVPPIVRSQLAKQLSARTGLPATVGAVRCNPFSLELGIEALALGPEGAAPWLGFDRFHANLQLASLWRWEFVLREVSLDGPRVLAHLNGQGELNLLQLAARLSTTTNVAVHKAPGLPAAFIQSLAISNVVVRWQDDFIAPGFASTKTGGSLLLTNFHTLATNAFQFAATLDDHTSLQATGAIALQPLMADVTASVARLSLGRYAAYIPAWSPLRLTNGVVDARIEVAATFNDSILGVTLRDATITVDDFVVVETAAGKPVLQIARTQLTGLGASLADRSFRLETLAIERPALAANRLTNGAMDWQGWLQQLLARLPAGDTNAAPWTWSAGDIRATNAVLRVTDAVPADVVSLTVTNASLAVRDLTNDLHQPLPIHLGFVLASGGQGTIKGALTPLPLAVDLALAVEDVFLPIAQPYLAGFLNATLQNGFGSVTGKVQARVGETNDLRAAFAGSVAAHDLVVLEASTGQPLAGVERVEVSGLQVAWPLDDLEIVSVNVTRPTASLVMHADGTSNVEDVVSRTLLEEAWHQLTQVWRSLQFKLDALNVTNGAVTLADEAIEPPVRISITDLLVELRGLQPNAETPATLNVGGKVEGQAPFSVVAEFKPEGTNLTAKVTVLTQVIALPPGSPYAGRWVGHLIDQGRVSVDLRYELNNQFIKGENRVIVDDFEFGAKTGSKDAVKLPVKLGVALLKDRNNRIDLDVPIEGDLSDPQMKLGRVIWRALVNIFEKAATAPFRFLGSLIGAGADEDLGAVAFAPGAEVLTEQEAGKLDKLAKALFQRPQLKLEIVGRFDPTADADAIRREKFEVALREFGAALATDEPFSALAAALEMTQPPARAELITLLYVKAHEIPFHLPTNAGPAAVGKNAPASSPPRVAATGPTPIEDGSTNRSWLGRSWKWLGRTLASDNDTPKAVENTKGGKAPKNAQIDSQSTTDPKTAAAPVTVAPPPILPELPSLAEMETKLLQRQLVSDEELRALAQHRAGAVQALLLTKPELTAERVVIREELSGAEPAQPLARVFLGIQ